MAIQSEKAEMVKIPEKERPKTLLAVPTPLIRHSVTHSPSDIHERLAEHSRKGSETTARSPGIAELHSRIAQNKDHYFADSDLIGKFSRMLSLI